MSDINMTSLADKLQDLELCLKGQHSKAHSYGRALREAILCMDISIEVEVLKSLGDWHLQKGKRTKDSTEFDKAAALYAAALLRCTDLDMGQTLEHRVGYMEKLSRQLLQGYTPLFRWLSPDYWGTTDSNVLRVAETCEKLDRSNKESQHSVEETYTETLVTAIENSDMFLEVKILKSLGDFYLEQGKKAYDVSQFSKSTAMYRKALTRREDPETKQTLHHRISYAEKIRAREAVRKQLATKKQMQIGRRPSMRQYKDHLKKGESSLTRSDLDSSEQHFAAALKAVHIPDPTAQQYQREVEPLRKLGDVYSKRGQQTGDGGDFVKAAALYNAAIASQENTQNHKKQLKVMRDQIKLDIETIDQQLDPYAHDEDDPCVKEIEAKRVLSNLGVAWSNLGEHMRELSYYEQALQMHRSIYGPQTAHPDIANSLNSLGAAWYSLGKYRKAVSYNEQALEMSRSVHGHTAHPHIATALNSLGTVWSRLGEHGRAVSYYEQSLLMFRGIYGQTAAHPDIATLLGNLGKLCVYLGEQLATLTRHYR
ncbi:KLC3 [Branchiostoma lanceolatum]|uniref:KLC3 protein n=1 Tax=Branchiostoma lanceolatum TaxID=7740 RepID=A0A8J9ZZ58_BRALA|nr:KLC3 [Branchiostoma lanceolatum]